MMSSEQYLGGLTWRRNAPLLTAPTYLEEEELIDLYQAASNVVSPDAMLVSAIRSGDEQAMEQLYERYSRDRLFGGAPNSGRYWSGGGHSAGSFHATLAQSRYVRCDPWQSAGMAGGDHA